MLELFSQFDNLPDKAETEAWLLEHGIIRQVPAGELLMKEGDPADHLTLVLSGQIELMLVHQSDRRMHLQSVLQAGSITGLLPYSRLKTATGRATARQDSDIYQLHRSQFRALIIEQPELTEALVHHMTTRVRDFTQQNVQAEKLAALGQMAAGLAHELNNPASALRSLAQELARRLDALAPALACLPAGGSERVILLLMHFPPPSASLSGLAKARSRRDLEDWLEIDLAMADAPTLASDLSDAGYTKEGLGDICQGLQPEEAYCLLTLQTQILGLKGLATDMGEASQRIFGLVQAVKDFSHMDQAQDAQPVVLADSLATTLRLMAHKFRESHVELENTLTADLPHALARPGELSQVWTNIIDNALYAAAKAPQPPGRIRIYGSTSGETVSISIEDNGAGIPADVLPRIFEPFYTTKNVGEGTGLGLELVRRIVVGSQGDVKVESKPGCTVFTVILPAAP